MDSLINKEKELKRIHKQLLKVKAELEVLQHRLISPGFLEKATENVIVQVKSSINEKQEILKSLEDSLSTISKMK